MEKTTTTNSSTKRKGVTPSTYVPDTRGAEAFVTDANGLKDTLKKHGVASIHNVLDQEEIKEMRDGMFSFLEAITQDFDTPIDRSKRSSWKSFYSLYPKHGMLLQHYGVGHAPFLWDLRQKESVISIFSTLWDTDDLLVSFDGCSFAFPHESTKRGYYRGKEKLHLDQRLCDPTFQCVQSWVTAWDVRPGDATLTVLEGSHALFEEFSRAFNLTSAKTDWHQLTPDQIQWYKDHGCVVRDITCPAGSMVFWDSRTVHSGKEAIKDRPRENFRGVGYLCYTPRSLASETDLKKKQKAFLDKRTTSHWPHRAKLFPKKPHTYGGPEPNVHEAPDPTMTRIGLRMAGFD